VCGYVRVRGTSRANGAIGESGDGRASRFGLRDRALLLAGWAGAFRRSALVTLDVVGLAFGTDRVALTIRRDKTDQEGRGRVVPVPFSSSTEVCPVRSLRAWLDAAGITEGVVFRGVDRHGKVSPARLSDRAVALIIKRAVVSIGGEASPFAGHSLRAGFATSAARSGRSCEFGGRRCGAGRWSCVPAWPKYAPTADHLRRLLGAASDVTHDAAALVILGERLNLRRGPLGGHRLHTTPCLMLATISSG
jgi:hypothetical protein